MSLLPAVFIALEPLPKGGFDNETNINILAGNCLQSIERLLLAIGVAILAVLVILLYVAKSKAQQRFG